jgi:uncharacterized protein (TIGR02444 family)
MALKEFILALYSNKDLATQSLRLQDDYQFNVNLLLTAIWLATHNVVDEKVWDSLIAATTGFDDALLKPLRAVRRSARDLEGQRGQTLYTQTKALELEYEFEQIATIEALLTNIVSDAGLRSTQPSVELALQNLMCYCKAARKNLTDVMKSELQSYSRLAVSLLH